MSPLIQRRLSHSLQRPFKTAVGRVFRRLGYQIVPYEPAPPAFGVDALRDIETLLQDVSEPIIFDVGANVGQSVVEFSKLLPGCQIHSFEPSPTTFEILRANVGDHPNVHLSNLGVGAQSRRSYLVENEHSDMSSFLEPAEAVWGEILGRTPVELTTLDEYCATHGIEHIDLLKSDTQGFELEVLRGAESPTSAGRINLIYLEVIFSKMYEAIPPFDALYRFLLDRDFRLIAFYNPAIVSQRISWCDCLFAGRTFVPPIAA